METKAEKTKVAKAKRGRSKRGDRKEVRGKGREKTDKNKKGKRQ